MLERLLDSIGDWNPQLMRELKCRLNLPNIAIATVISLLAQALPWILPGRISQHDTTQWWLRVSEILNREIWLGLTIGGIYLLTADFDREIRRGTLDILKLTPAKSIEISIGKIIGVPILIYWAVFLALPLHLVAIDRIASIAPNAWVWDFIKLSLIGLLYFISVLTTLQLTIPPIVLSPILSAIGWAGVNAINESRLSHRMSGNYSSLGVYFSEEWWSLSIAIVNFIIASFVVSKLIQLDYSQARERQNFSQSWIYFVCNSSLLFAFIVTIGLIPLLMVVLAISIGLILLFNSKP
jgi:hypothetical protein